MTESRGSRRDEEFKATADAIAEKAQRVEEIEEEKSKLSPDDPAARRLSGEAESLIDSMGRDSAVERSIEGGDDEGYAN